MSDPTVIKLPKKTLVSFSPRSGQKAVVYVDHNNNGKLDTADKKLIVDNTASARQVIRHKVTAADIQRHGKRFKQSVSKAKADSPSLKKTSFAKGTCFAHWSSKWWAPSKKVTFGPSLTASTRVTTSKQLVCTRETSKGRTIRNQICTARVRKGTIDPGMCRTVRAKKTITIGKGAAARKQPVTASAGMSHYDYPLWLESAVKEVATQNITNWSGQTGIHYFVGKKLFIHFAIPGNAPHTLKAADRLRRQAKGQKETVRGAQRAELTMMRLAKP